MLIPTTVLTIVIKMTSNIIVIELERSSFDVRMIPVKAIVGDVGCPASEKLCTDAASSNIKIVIVVVIFPLAQHSKPYQSCADKFKMPMDFHLPI